MWRSISDLLGLEHLGAVPEKLVWDREGAIHAGGGRPTEEFAAFCGQLAAAWISLDPGDAEAKGLGDFKRHLEGRLESPSDRHSPTRVRHRQPPASTS